MWAFSSFSSCPIASKRLGYKESQRKSKKIELMDFLLHVEPREVDEEEKKE
jgi:hypothetical protein